MENLEILQIQEAFPGASVFRSTRSSLASGLGPRLNVICIVLFFLIFLQKIKVALYARFDVNGDGEITFWEVWQVLKERFGGRPPPPAEPTKEPEVWAGKVPEAEGKAGAGAWPRNPASVMGDIRVPV